MNYIPFNHIKGQIIFKDVDLFINASWFEGLPNALVQSINNNIFPICSKSPGGNLEVIKYNLIDYPRTSKFGAKLTITASTQLRVPV